MDILKRNPNSKNAGEIRNTMERQLVNLVRLIDDLLDVSHVGQGEVELRKAPVRIDEIVNSGQGTP